MGTCTTLFIGWSDQDTVSTVLSRLLGETIALPSEDTTREAREAHESITSELNRRLGALSLPTPLTLSFEGYADYSGDISGLWLLTFDGASSADWIGAHDGLSGGPVKLGALKATSAAARQLARARRLPLPSLGQITVTEDT